VHGSDRTTGDDVKLVTLVVLQGQLAAYLKDDGWSKNHLHKIFGFTTGWLMLLGVADVRERITAERERQNALFAEGQIGFNCSSRIVDPARKLRVLTEEIGEVAQAIDLLENPKPFSRVKAVQVNFREELVQVAAVAVAWLESMEAK
jgi:hypothetical protein